VTDHEWIFVDDGSRDGSFEVLKELHEKAPEHLFVLRLSRNFGKEAAMLAGLEKADGDFCGFLDADLQQDPRTVIEMLKILLAHPQTDVVAAVPENKKDGAFLRFCKKRFYKILSRSGQGDVRPGASDFRLFRRKVANALLSVTEYYRFSKGIFAWMGFETEYLPYRVGERGAGKTKWSFRKLFRYGLDGVLSFTTFPLQLSIYLGVFVSLCSFLYMIAVIVQKLAFGIAVPGYATVVVLILLLSGIQLLMLGIIGEYLAKTYIQTKNRPLYLEKEYLSKKK